MEWQRQTKEAIFKEEQNLFLALEKSMEESKMTGQANLTPFRKSNY
jgi:hypothetical protein